MKTVYVVAYETKNSSGGFNWFYTKEASDKAFEKAKKDHLRFDLDVTRFATYQYESEVSSYETATDEIDRNLIEDCATAFRAGNYCGAELYATGETT